MSFWKLLVLGGAAVGGYQYWNQHKAEQALIVATDASGFVSLIAPDGAGSEVIVLAPINCPKEGAQRAEALAQSLRSRNIPVRQIDSVSFSAAQNADPGLPARLNSVMRGEVPIVFIKDRAKANPDVDEVINTWRESRRRPG